MKQYSNDLIHWENLPSEKMSSYHRPAMKNGIVCSALLINKIITPNNLSINWPNNWFKTSINEWQNTRMPTRKEFLIRNVEFGNKKVHIILQLHNPYFTWLR